jgi:hypothetical protein
LNDDEIRRLLSGVVEEYEGQGWFQAKLGKDCPDNPFDVGAVVLEGLGRDLWPFSRFIRSEPDEWMLSIIEFADFSCAKPTRTYFHNWDACGTHVLESDQEAGRTEFRDRINAVLARWGKGFSLQESGEIWEAAPTGLDGLDVASSGESTIDSRVEAAIRVFRRHNATDADKRHAVRDLADVMEYLKATGGTRLLTKDESDLFNLANNYLIRHVNPQQKADYDAGVGLSWMFYTYLNAINLSLNLRVPDPDS